LAWLDRSTVESEKELLIVLLGLVRLLRFYVEFFQCNVFSAKTFFRKTLFIRDFLHIFFLPRHSKSLDQSEGRYGNLPEIVPADFSPAF
jgi:hypothetical protein